MALPGRLSVAPSGMTKLATPRGSLRTSMAVSIMAGTAAMDDVVVKATAAPGVMSRANRGTLGTRTSSLAASPYTSGPKITMPRTTAKMNTARLRSIVQPNRAATGAARQNTPTGATSMIHTMSLVRAATAASHNSMMVRRGAAGTLPAAGADYPQDIICRRRLALAGG